MANIFKDEFVPNIQTHNRTSYAQWKQSNPGEAAKWEKYRDDLIAGKKPVPPTMATKYGKALVAGGKMSVTDVGTDWGIPPDPPPDPGPPATGDLFAAPNGNDANPGTLASPYRTFAKLCQSLTAGQVGMLRGGTYAVATTHGDFTANGTSTSRITVTNYPGERVIVKGTWAVYGAFWTFSNIHFDVTNNYMTWGACGTPANPQALGIAIIGSDTIVEDCELFFSGPYRGSAVLQGLDSQNKGHRNIYRRNIIRDWGQCLAQDHGIYVGFGQDVQIYKNWFYNDAQTVGHGFGIQLYPHATRTRVYSNVFDKPGAGIVISDGDTAGYPADPNATNNCDVYNNVFSNAIGLLTPYITSGAALAGIGCQSLAGNNKFRDNCAWNCPEGAVTDSSQDAQNILISGNLENSNPLFVNAAAHDYRVQAGSPAAGYGLPTTIPGPTV